MSDAPDETDSPDEGRTPSPVDDGEWIEPWSGMAMRRPSFSGSLKWRLREVTQARCQRPQQRGEDEAR